MRILLIAYEFPPSPSPQSLRWAYLSRELARMGHEVHVLTADLGWSTAGLPELPPQVAVHRVFGGPIAGILAMLAKRQADKAARFTDANLATAGGMTIERSAVASTIVSKQVIALRDSQLNWKGRLVARLKDVATQAVFPDARGEWYFPALRAAPRLVEDIRPDLIVSSHEPATTLELGIELKRRFRGIPWIADLGDPVLADYTPWRWRRRALRVERQALALADGVIVTAPGTRDLLLERHRACAADPAKYDVEILTQGFEDQPGIVAPPASGLFDGTKLELLYTGSFYHFRRPDALLDSIAKLPRVRLSIASSNIPDWLRSRLEANPEQFRLLGFLPHRTALSLQRYADVLVNIANDNPCQVPGKVYEYLGSGRPILHIGNMSGADVSAELIHGHGRGWVCGNDQDVIGNLLCRLVDEKQDELLRPSGLDLEALSVSEFGWSRLARRFEAIAERVIRESA